MDRTGPERHGTERKMDQGGVAMSDVQASSVVEAPLVLTEQRGAVLEITMNRPRVRNALSFGLLRMLADRLLEAARDDRVRVAILTGAGGTFAAGADIRELSEMTGADFVMTDVFRAWDEVAQFPKPILAAVQGYALGGGCELALSCDLIVAAQDARFAQPELSLGVIPGAGGTQRLPRIVGKYLAAEMVLAGRFLSSTEAERLGMVNRVVPSELVMDSAREIADRIGSLSPLAVRQAKAALRAAFEGSLSQGLEGERQRFYTLFGSEDQREGTRAFLDKRAPAWKGR